MTKITIETPARKESDFIYVHGEETPVAWVRWKQSGATDADAGRSASLRSGSGKCWK